MDSFYDRFFGDRLIVNLPERSDDNLCSATKLLDMRREKSEVEQALAANRDEFQRRMETLQQRRDELQRKEFQMKQSLLKFDKFVKDNDSKRQQASRRQVNQRDARMGMEKEIKCLKARMSELGQQRNHMAEKAAKYSRFHRFCEKAVELSAEFEEIRELMGRYDTLSATHETLLQADMENQNKMQTERHEQSLFLERMLNEKLRCTAILSNLQERLDALQSECLRLEAIWQNIQINAAAKTLEMGRIKMAAYNLFRHVQQVNAERGQEVVHRAEMDTAGQLKDIQRCILELTEVSNSTKRLMVEESQRLSARIPTSRAVTVVDALIALRAGLARAETLSKSSRTVTSQP